MRVSVVKVLSARAVIAPLMALTLVLLSFVSTASAQSARNQIEGVQNFGEVTERYFRGGAVTPDGVDKLASMGVKTIIDLRDKPSEGEPEACKRNGIKYYKFPMDGSATPDDKAVDEILSIIQNAKEPVYVHCSAGKHRAGTIAALYRTRVQGWSKERAWAEQRSYGFGPAEERPALYAYVYGSDLNKSDVNTSRINVAVESKNKAAKSKKSQDDDDGDAKTKEKGDKKSKKDKARSESVEAPMLAAAKSEPSSEMKPDTAAKSLSADANYVKIGDAIKRAHAEGAIGEVLKVDLEWDEARSTVSWDVTFSSGNEYEVDALSGKYLGVKAKAPAKLAVLKPLRFNEQRWLNFQEVIRKAEKERGQVVKEMELKNLNGRSEAIFEVSLADGTAIFYDALTGKVLTDL